VIWGDIYIQSCVTRRCLGQRQTAHMTVVRIFGISR